MLDDHSVVRCFRFVFSFCTHHLGQNICSDEYNYIIPCRRVSQRKLAIWISSSKEGDSVLVYFSFFKRRFGMLSTLGLFSTIAEILVRSQVEVHCPIYFSWFIYAEGWFERRRCIFSWSGRFLVVSLDIKPCCKTFYEILYFNFAYL